MKSRFLRTEKQLAESGRTLERLLIVLLVIGSGGVTKAGLIGYWKLDGTARDCSGYYNDGIETGTPSYVEGVRGQAISLSGDGESVLLPNEPHFDLIAGFTVAAWIRFNEFAGKDQAIVTKGRQAWRIGRDEEHDYVGLYCNDVLPSERLIATVRIDDGQWHHVAGAYDGSHMYLYIDGRLNGSMAVSDYLDDHDDTVGIGGHPKMDAESYFGGLIDEVTIFKPCQSSKSNPAKQ
ncbi:MAG: LamG domain-containing protein [Planctomycetota bacterium]|jgi:beta-galactosidase